MNFLAPIPLSTIATFAAIAGGLTIVAYILKMRRRRFEVPFSTLWQRVLKKKETTSLWRHLRRLLSLLLAALAILGTMFLATTEPELGEADEDARNIVLVVDASASMETVDERRGSDKVTRLEKAKEKAHELVDSMGGGDTAMIMQMDGQTSALTRFESDHGKTAQNA